MSETRVIDDEQLWGEEAFDPENVMRYIRYNSGGSGTMANGMPMVLARDYNRLLALYRALVPSVNPKV